MATLPIEKPLVTVEEYLRSVYRPDCEHVDGRIEERNLGEHDHGLLQALLSAVFTNNRVAWGVRTLTEVRTRVRSTRFRVPDISVLRSDAPREPIITHPQLIAIEILSPEDRLNRLQEKLDDYLQFGVEHVWVIDPETRRAWTAEKTGLRLVQNGELNVPGTPIRVVLSQMFAELDHI